MKLSMFPWLPTLIVSFLLISFSVKPISSVVGSYSNHCSSTVMESVPNSRPPDFEFGPFGSHQSGFYYSDGNFRVVSANITRYLNSFSFYTTVVDQTDKDGTFMIEGSFELHSQFYFRSPLTGTSKDPDVTPHEPPVVAEFKNPFVLKLHGFWSESSGKLCMVGTGSAYLKEGTLLSPAAVLKLHNIKNSSSITSLITGTLESLSPSNDNNYFEPISILMHPQRNYKFTFVSGDSTDEFSSESDSEKSLPIYSVLQGRSFCSNGVIADLPGSMSLAVINCTDVQKRVQIFLKFEDNTKFSSLFHRFNPNTTLIGEGMWDEKKYQLHVLLCRFLDIANSWSNARVGDCTTSLSLRFPAIWSIKETSTIMGQIWTNKTEDDSGYFERIVFRSTRNHIESPYNLKYEYTELDRVRDSCPEKKLDRNKRQRYPSPYSSEMKFNMLVKGSKGRTGWGSADVLAIDKQFPRHTVGVVAVRTIDGFERSTKWEPQGRANLSYKIDIKLHTRPKLADESYASVVPDEKMEITAEGIYDADTGSLCMVGCRKFALIDRAPGNASMDCNILLNFQLAPVKGLENGGYIRGRIESTWEESDLLYFDHLDVSSTAYSREQARHSIWTMDLEIALVVISQTLACLFVRSQLYHAKRHPKTLPFTSLVMLVILTMGQLIPLVLNYEALFNKKLDPDTLLFQTGGWLEANEVILRITSMIAFLLQFRILQQAFSSRSNHGNQKGLWFAEKMTLFVTLSLYISGAFIVMLVDRGNYKREIVLLPTRTVDYWQRSAWDDLKSYAGLISDGFLLPQILFNMFSNSREYALSPSFYISTSLVRLLPHAYDLYNDHSYVQYKGAYIYVNPADVFFSTAWDVIIPIGVLLFAAIIYLQQQCGGCCIVPKSFRWRESYEKIPSVRGTTTEFVYGHYCDSVVHESGTVDEEFKVSPFPGRQNGYYRGGGNLLNRSSDQYYYPPASKVLVFETHHVYMTRIKDVFKVEGNLIFESSYYYEQSFSNHRGYYYSYSSDSSARGALDFDFHGFWSRATGKLCMVGSGYTFTKEGKQLHLAAVLKLNNVTDSSDIYTIITGTMDSLYHANEPNYFDPISVLMFPLGSYKYTKASTQFSQGCPGGTDFPKTSSLSLTRTRPVCDMFSVRGKAFELEYAMGCDSSKSCSPLGDGARYSPRFMYLSMIQCSDDMQSIRFLIEFPDDTYMRYSSSSNFSTSLIGEGSWDAKQNRLCIVACRIEDASSSSLEKSHVGDCTTRLSLRFPAVLSIRNTSTLTGEIWSEKLRNESGFFNRIVFRDTDNNQGQIQLQGLKYEYMETDNVKKSCPKKSINGNSSRQYPMGYSTDMAFSMSIKGPKGSIGWGSSSPLAVGDQPDQMFPFLIPSSSSRPKRSDVDSDAGVSLLNISYKMRIELSSSNLDAALGPFNQSSNRYLEIQISAEGVYDAEFGHLCMIGCRHLRLHNKSMEDCKILINVQFPPLNSDRKGSKIKGSIESTRDKSDHLHFKPLEFSGRAYYNSWAVESIWRMDFEMVMSVISNTLAIVFVVLQIFHMFRRKEQGLVDCRKEGALRMLSSIHSWRFNHWHRRAATFVVLHREDHFGMFKSICWVHNYADVADSYIYADPTADYYSTAWDFIIPMVGLFFAATVYLQQRFGGRCFLPKRFRESVVYEELPVDSEEQFPLKSSS
ncbi:hypothetical protein V6N13_117634 [Hibiscus sabdariffa]